MIAASARAHSTAFYSPEEVEAAIAHVFGVDSELVADGSYLVAEWAGTLAGCGGWSRRPTLFGGDRFAARATGVLSPARDAARIRAFFVAPGHDRRGVASALLASCEAAAAQAGFSRTALMSTLPGVRFYERHGYVAEPAITHVCGTTPVGFVPMSKLLLK